ncbi:replication endonuclease [Acidomonas methanolica]|uniref:replication endonuclease n=1 Tax=Acidomonas methanolica TaxID=437 RepID=UPI002119C470|nr:replication endonuclease [Acidomonas methanolica]MCQ9156121.1 hypothetical protein [Acidomonas methanolica]
MSYDLLEQCIYDEDIATYDIITALHPFYRYKLYQKIKENSRLSDDCDIQELALNVIRMLPRLKKSVIDSFEIISLFYGEIRQHHGITTQQANKARINMRKILSISRDDDEVQKQFDTDKKNRYSRLKYGKYSVQDSIDKKLSNNRSRDWHIATSLNESMKFAGLTQSPIESGWFITLTLPSKYRSLSYEQCIEEVNNRLNNIKKYAERSGIVWTGTYVIELHKDETPHIHIIYYVNDFDIMKSQGLRCEKIGTDKQKLEKIIFKFFKEEELRAEVNGLINQEITYFERVLSYIFKDYGKPNTRHGFIGLRRDIRSVWNNLYLGNYGHKSLSYLSDDRLWKSKKYIHSYERIHGDIKVPCSLTLFALRCFKSDKLNHLGGEISLSEYNELSMFEKMKYNKKHIEMYELLNKKKSTNKIRKYNKTLKLLNVNSVFVYLYLYINTKIVYCNFIIEKARGQPPPGERTG